MRLRILIFTISFEMGGAENRALKLARFFKMSGHHVELWSFHGPGVLQDKCRLLSIPTQQISFPWAGLSIQTIKSFLKIMLKMRDMRPDWILPHTLLPIISTGFLWRFVGARRCIGYIGGAEFGLFNHRIEKYAINLLGGVICNARHLASDICQNYAVSKNKLKIIHNGIDLPPLHPDPLTLRQSYQVPVNAFVCTMVANLSPFKNHMDLILTWQIIVNKCGGDHTPILLLAGKDFGMGEKLKKEVIRLNLDDHVKFLGYVQDIAGVLSISDLCVFSSRAEGAPNGILEAMSLGLPVVATDNPGVREVVGPHQHAWLARPGDHQQFASLILELSTAHEQRKKLGELNKTRVEQVYSLDQMCQKTEQFITNHS